MSARVLVVDDVPANVKLLEARLSAEYFDVTTANCGAEALAICERAECDIVLLDVMMPGMDGPSVLKALRLLEPTRETPVVFITARAQSHERHRFLDLGAAGVITKPFDPMTLATELRAVMAAGPVA